MLRAALLAAGVAAAGGLQPFSPWLQRGYCSAAAASSSDSSAASSPTAGPEQMLNLHRIAGDGRCLFRSLAQGAHLAAQVDAAAAAGGDAHPLLLLQPAQETAAADELRAAICRELLRRREELCFFIDGDYDEYVAVMQRPHAWGGEPELAVAAHVLRRAVSVYTDAPREFGRSPRVPRGALTLVSRYGEGEYDELADVPVLFHGTGHYDLLVVAAAQPHQLRSRL